MADIVFETPERMHLLGYFLRSALRRATSSLDGQRTLRELKARVLIETGGMKATLVLEPERIAIARGEAEPIDARISGSMPAFLRALRTGNFVAPVVLRRVRVSGPWSVLLGLLRLFRG